MAHRIGIIGFGKIAQDQHLPAIRGNPDFELVAVASQRGIKPDEARHAFRDYREMLREVPELDAVAICTPPQVRHVIARDVLLAGKSALLEKPPAATLSELEDLRRIAGMMRKVVFTTWHAQYNRGVEVARDTLKERVVTRLLVTWKEDVRHWHPGQQWIWEPGGFGVFDPGINALSIVTRIMPEPVFVRTSELEFPANREAPIAARLGFTTGRDGPQLEAVFDWRQTGPQTWDIAVETDGGPMVLLSQGGSRLQVDGQIVVDETPDEYGQIYRRYDTLLREGLSEVDDAPFRLVADAFMIGRRLQTEPFLDDPATGR